MTGGEAIYGVLPAAVASAGASAVQLSPLVVGATPLEEIADGSLRRITVAAPPGVLERRYVLAHGLRALEAEGELVAAAPKTLGGARIARELGEFGCPAAEASRRHHRICRCTRPVEIRGLEAAIAAGGPRLEPGLGLWTQPGVFSWDRVDPGTTLLLEQPWAPAGAGADLGCGLGLLARGVLASTAVTRLTLFDIDRRALEAARRNLDDPRAQFVHADLRREPILAAALDFTIMNPPFHNGGVEDRGLGGALVRAAAAMLRPGGVLRMVANVALPYERILEAAFSQVRLLARTGGFKAFEAMR